MRDDEDDDGEDVHLPIYNPPMEEFDDNSLQQAGEKGHWWWWQARMVIEKLNRAPNLTLYLWADVFKSKC